MEQNMKKYKRFFVSMFITVFVLSGIVIAIIVSSGPKSTYSTSAYVAVSNGAGIIQENSFDILSCTNEEDEFQLEIRSGSGEERMLKFEISFLVNYEQTYFYLNDSKEPVRNYIFSGQDEFKIRIDKSSFDLKNNQLIINIRQDIEVTSKSNELVRDSNTINLRYNVINSEKTKESNHDIYIVDTIENYDPAEGAGVVCQIRCVNREDQALIKIAKNEDLKMQLEVGGSTSAGEYVVIAYLNSEQTEIDNKSNLYLEVDKNSIGMKQVEITMPRESGEYELEVFVIPLPFDYIDSDAILQYNVVSAQRYTIEVE